MKKNTDARCWRIGNTTYLVSVHFSQTRADTLEDKVKRLIREEARQM